MAGRSMYIPGPLVPLQGARLGGIGVLLFQLLTAAVVAAGPWWPFEKADEPGSTVFYLHSNRTT